MFFVQETTKYLLVISVTENIIPLTRVQYP